MSSFSSPTTLLDAHGRPLEYLRLAVTMYFKPVHAYWKQAESRPVSVSFLLLITGLVTIWSGFGPFNLLGIVPGLTPLLDWLQAIVI